MFFLGIMCGLTQVLALNPNQMKMNLTDEDLYYLLQTSFGHLHALYPLYMQIQPLSSFRSYLNNRSLFSQPESGFLVILSELVTRAQPHQH